MSNRRISWAAALRDLNADRSAPRYTVDQLDARQAARAAHLARVTAEIAAEEAAKREGRTGYTLRETDISVPCYREFDVLLDGVAVAKLTDEVGNEGVWLVVNRGVNSLPPRFTHFATAYDSVFAVCDMLGAKHPN